MIRKHVAAQAFERGVRGHTKIDTRGNEPLLSKAWSRNHSSPSRLPKNFPPKELTPTVAIRDNKFTRQAAVNAERGIRDSQPTLDEQLSRLEEDLRRLKVEYDIYFNNATKRPPYDTKSRVESVIKRLADDRTFTFAQRYHYNSLVARYTSFRELWRRNVQEREEGRDAATQARNARGMTLAAKPIATVSQTTFTCADAHADTATVRSIYDALITAKKAVGEVTDDFSFPRFHRMIAAQTDALKTRLACDRVRFSISVADGQVSFKAKADK